ncbi:MAG: FecR domain-containing protein [Dyadobacter sp.]|uniref:FecR family protein n=1 Tax=Dyadobacter sp. TaxID=1914288 RepID=UPI001B01DC4F|nr:FecR domain-containing protein [Dyadobacter sp.]MBO9611228.1 FecR domain-containing protein [Dyadobacter sp.]
MKPEMTKYAVFAHFSGDATPLQKEMMGEWLKDRRNVELYFEWLDEWEKMHLQFQPDTAEALAKISEKLQDPADAEVVLPVVPTLHFWKRRGFLWAAACLFLVGIGAFMGRDILTYGRYETAFGEQSKFLLADGTEVVLNANSRLKVPRWGFGKSTRHVYLEGEAEFSVRHTVDHQYFKVHNADNSLITVLGTEFVVYTRAKQTSVVLNKGKVELSSPGSEQALTMSPGDRATIETSGEIVVEKLSKQQLAQHSAWKEHRFVFDDTPLREVAVKIHELFGVEVKIKDKGLAARTATGSFPAKNAEELLTIMSYMYNFEIQKTDDKVILIPNP